MKRCIGFILAIAMIGASVAGAQSKATNLTGKWNVALSGRMENVPIVLELKQDGKAVTGNFLIPDHGDLEVTGEFMAGQLKFSSTENAFMQMSATGKLNDDGTLSGNITSMMGDMTWTAKRMAAE
jgi:hypothetical protein